MLENKVACITGGTRGIGRAIAQTLAEQGCRVAMTYASRDDDATSAEESLRSGGAEVLVERVDVRDRPAMRRIYGKLEARFGGLDILVNNAGINRPADFDAVTDEDWDEVLSVNLKGPFICSQEALPFMKKRGGGSIINIASVSGQIGGPRTVHYAASKAGLISLSQVIARFGAPHNIRSNSIAAGLIASEMADEGLASPAVQEAAKSILLGRMGTGDEVANVVLFLASDASSYVTAQTLNVNGGLYF